MIHPRIYKRTAYNVMIPENRYIVNMKLSGKGDVVSE
jgi:hypothetical protein